MFAIAIVILIFSLANEDGFEIIWRYFAWSNQVLAVITLWAITMFLKTKRNGWWWLISFIPAMFMTCMTLTFILYAKIGAGLDYNIAVILSVIFTLLCSGLFIFKANKRDCKLS